MMQNSSSMKIDFIVKTRTLISKHCSKCEIQILTVRSQERIKSLYRPLYSFH